MGNRADYDDFMHNWPDALIVVLLCATVFLSLGVGLWFGAAKRRCKVPDKDHLGTIQGAILGLLGLVLGFSFSGAMSRFIDRQDALAVEANAIETAYERAALLPNAVQVQDGLRDYAGLRLELFRLPRGDAANQTEQRMRDRYDATHDALMEGVLKAPQFANLAVVGIEAVQDEFERRSAFDRRHLPTEMLLVLIASSCLSMGVIGYGVGLAEQRATGSALALAALVAVTLFLTVDFDRPRRGYISLDGSVLERMNARLNAPGRRAAAGDGAVGGVGAR